MKTDSLNRRVTSLEVLQPTERDTRQDLGWPAYKDTLLKYLADYPQKGLLEDVQRAFKDLEGRPAPVTNTDVFYAIDPLLRKHYEEFAPNPQTADHLALIARFKALGASDEDLVDFYKYVRKYQEEDKYRIAGKCADCGADIREARHMWECYWRDGDLVSKPLCMKCWRPNY